MQPEPEDPLPADTHRRGRRGAASVPARARIPFNRPHTVGTEWDFIRQAIEAGHLSGDGQFSRGCRAWLEARTGADAALLVHSCTAALELATRLAGVGPGDEVILPSFTFTSSANAIVLAGGVPVFVDVREDTLNIDESLIHHAITSRTKAIMPVHYAGVGCQMEPICALAEQAGLAVIEDAAQGLMASYRGRELGSIGHMGAISFHETKNVTSGEGGALLLNRERFVERAEIIREKGTNRSKFFRGEVDKYSWVDVGSSYVISELNAAYLWAQLQHAERITSRRLDIWGQYHDAFASVEAGGFLRRPIIADGCVHNAHMYYLLLPTSRQRDQLLRHLNGHGVNAVFHYVPLHSSPAGIRFGRSGDLPVTDDISGRLLRLPIWPDMSDADVRYVASEVNDWLHVAAR